LKQESKFILGACH